MIIVFISAMLICCRSVFLYFGIPQLYNYHIQPSIILNMNSKQNIRNSKFTAKEIHDIISDILLCRSYVRNKAKGFSADKIRS